MQSIFLPKNDSELKKELALNRKNWCFLNKLVSLISPQYCDNNKPQGRRAKKIFQFNISNLRLFFC